ncbi:MAG: prolipoprotein diacylglyceryl transferase [Alphaproteobacteria bacterium]|nr:prolipoprotein diacylglyceryl transferase [Alphaproteobacteria bacterium]
MDLLHVAIMCVAVLTGVAVRRLVRTPSTTTPGESAGIAMAAIFGGVIGAKLPFLLQGGLQSFDIWLSDGRTVTWALAGGYLSVELMKLALGVTAKTGDGFAAPVAASVAIGRIGCFQGGCCYGVATALPWGVDFGDGVLRHPTQLYEAAFHAAAAVAFVIMNRTNALPRQHFKLYLGTYCVYRFATEWLRPEPAWLLGLTFYQVSVAIIGAAMAAHFVWDARETPTPIGSGAT